MGGRNPTHGSSRPLPHVAPRNSDPSPHRCLADISHPHQTFANTSMPYSAAVTGIKDAPLVPAEDRAAWRGWLEANHATAAGAWLVTWRKGHGPVLDYAE